jgi:hypothetical protein
LTNSGKNGIQALALNNIQNIIGQHKLTVHPSKDADRPDAPAAGFTSAATTTAQQTGGPKDWSQAIVPMKATFC